MNAGDPLTVTYGCHHDLDLSFALRPCALLTLGSLGFRCFAFGTGHRAQQVDL